MRFLRRIAFLLVLLTGLDLARGFVMIGPMATNRLTALGIDLNYTDDLGGPKERKNFYRWNMPSLTYSFDASFINYFGLEGRFAINEAMSVFNDFFSNEDYDGMSNLDLASSDHGFHGNYSTTWVNITAQNQSILDIKSLTLGLMVNQLGLGNPHRYAFSIHDATTNQSSTIINFRVRLRNFDPVTENPTDMINNVKYSYRLVHDGTNSPGVGNPPFIMPNFADMEEFTTDNSGNAWTAVAGIADAFYGNTALFWTDTPTLFNFGVYYSGINAMGDKYEPRHALTYDDAGGLRYLYRKNNFVYETMPSNVVLVVPPSVMKSYTIAVFPGVPTGRLFPDSLGGSQGFVPLRRTESWMPSMPITSTFAAPEPPLFYDLALRGGIDKIKLYEQPFDSLIGITFTATNLIWTDRFVTPNAQETSGTSGTVPGSELFQGVPQMTFSTQEVGRAVWMPDIIFVADELGLSPDGVPIGWTRTDATNWMDNYTNTLGPTPLLSGSTNMGPGVIVGPVQFTFTRIHEEFEVLWSGESSVVGNLDTYSLWGHIRGPGPNDVVVFPKDVRHAIIENAIAPAEGVPVISQISDDEGVNSINTGPISGGTKGDGNYTRTSETLTLTGLRLASVRVIQIMNGNDVNQTISPATEFIVSDSRIDIPPGTISDAAEGVNREIRVWSTLGYSEKAPEKFTIETGVPILRGTSADGLVYNRAESLILQGFGFKSIESNATQIAYIRIDASNGTAIWPSDKNVTEVEIDVKSDTLAELSANSVSALADGSNRYLRVSRIHDNTQLSAISNVQTIAAISAKPVITSYTAEGMTAGGGEFRRDRSMDIRGTALNTTYKIEVVQEDGTSFTPALSIDLPHPGVFIEDSGTRIQISANVFLNSDADANTTSETREFKIYNTIANTDHDQNGPLHFNVNVQPQIGFIGAFASTGAFNRHATEGDDIFISGSGFKAVGEIHLTGADGNDLNSYIDANATGVTITDTSISIDTSQLKNGFSNSTDSNPSSQYRLFALHSARDPAMSPGAQQFNVGIPPDFTSLSGITNNHYRRDADTLEVNGTGLGMITRVEIVDSTGVAIPNLNAIDTNGGVTLVSPQSITLAANATGWRPAVHRADSVAALSRRLKITTPFGSITTDANSSGAFTVSATPAFFATPQATFAGGGYDGGEGTDGTYDLSHAALHINGQNLRGVKQIALEDNASTNYATITLNPAAPPSGITFSEDGTLITISTATITSHNATWADNDSLVMKRVTVVSAADQNATTMEINTRP